MSNYHERTRNLRSPELGDISVTRHAASEIAAEADEEIARLRAELERERLRLAACGVVASSNTPESAKRARTMHPDYESASCSEVAEAVDREMAMRARIEVAQSPGLAAEIWAAAQLVPSEGIEDGIARIQTLLRERTK